MRDRHPSEADLAMFASGDSGWLRELQLKRHVSRCGDCRDTVASYGEVRTALQEVPLPDALANEAGWNRMAGEMRANIRLGLAAGECIGSAPEQSRPRNFSLGLASRRLAVGMAGVVLLAGAGLFLRGLLPHGDLPAVVHAAVVESSGAGVEVRTDRGSMTLLNGGDSAGNQTVTSQGAIRASYVDGNTGTVTVTSVYVE